MVMPTKHVITGPDLHRAGPQALREFLQDLSAKCRGSKLLVSLVALQAAILWY